MRKPIENFNPLVADPREVRLVSWAGRIIDHLRREVREMRAVLDHQVNEHKDSDVWLKRYAHLDKRMDEIPIKKGSHVQFRLPHPVFMDQHVAIECHVEGAELYVRSISGYLVVRPRVGNEITVRVTHQ